MYDSDARPAHSQNSERNDSLSEQMQIPAARNPGRPKTAVALGLHDEGILADRALGLSVKVTAQRLGVSYSTIFVRGRMLWKMHQHNGVSWKRPRRDGTSYSHGVTLGRHDQRIKRMEQEGKTRDDMTFELGCSQTTLMRRLRLLRDGNAQ